MSDKIVLEQNKRFSESALYDFMRDYFDQQGVDAWVSQVPFYVTSNPFIANCYANLFIQLMRDWVKLHPEAKKHPFYIMELGTGSGKFSFYVLKKVYELRRQLGMEDFRFCYIMSDFTKNNLKYWAAHPNLQLFLNEGLLDFAVYNMENDDPIVLQRQNITLTPESFVNPLTVFANYIFDTVSQDAFIVNNGHLQELLISLSAEKDNMHNNKPIDWEQVQIDYNPYELKGPRYDDEVFNAVLDEYKTALTDSSFLIPIGGLKAMKKLHRLSNNKLFLISSDKGYSSLDSMDHLDHPRPSFHGSFSMMVNFHAIASYFKHRGGDYVLQSPRKGIKTVICCNGFKLADMRETTLAIQQCVEGFSPADYFTLHRRISDSYQECDLDTIAAHLMLADWDPHIFNRINNRICAIVADSDVTTIEFMANNMHKVMEHFYYMPKADNVAFEIAIFFHSAKNYRKAIEYYQLAEPLLGEQFGLTYNLALCRYYNDEPQEALVGFKRALEIDPNSKEAKEWVEFINTHNPNETNP